MSSFSQAHGGFQVTVGPARQEDQLDSGTEQGWYGCHQASKYGTAPTMSAFPEWLLPLSRTFPKGWGKGQEGILLPDVRGIEMAGLEVSGPVEGTGEQPKGPLASGEREPLMGTA